MCCLHARNEPGPTLGPSVVSAAVEACFVGGVVDVDPLTAETPDSPVTLGVDPDGATVGLDLVPLNVCLFHCDFCRRAKTSHTSEVIASRGAPPSSRLAKE